MCKFIFMMLLVLFSIQNQAKNLDPTRPLSKSSQIGGEQVKQSLTLETIIHGDKKKSAIISGKLLAIGDHIGEHELIVVNASHVILRSDDERIKLSIFSHVVTK